MDKVYILTQREVDALYSKLYKLRNYAMDARNAGDTDASYEFYLRAKGFGEAMEVVGLKTTK